MVVVGESGRPNHEAPWWAVYPPVLYPLVWFAHFAGTELDDPLGVDFDFMLWVFAALFKLAAGPGFLWWLARVHMALLHSRKRALSAFLAWVGASCAALTLLALTRSTWAPRVRTDAAKFYFEGDQLKLYPALAEHRRECLAAWNSGIVTSTEALVLVALAAIHALSAYFFGNRPRLSVSMGCVASLLTLIAYLALSPWFRVDYDNFHGDTLVSPIAFDLLFVVASDPYATLALVAYVPVLCVTYWMARRYAA